MVPIVVVGGQVNTLGVVRSLAPSGARVFVASDTRWCPAALSRFGTFARVPDLKERALIDGLKSIAADIGEKAVLILGGDRQVTAVSEARAELESLFYLDLPAMETVTLLGDKAMFQVYAERVGFPVPRAVIVEQGSDLSKLDRLSMPAVVKPADKALVLAGLVERAVKVETHDEAKAVCANMLRRASCVLVQEWIEGEDTDIYFTLFVCDAHSRITSLFLGRKLICDPPHVGNTALCISAGPEHQALAELTRQFVEKVRYQGIGGLEIKQHRRTDQYLIVEPTVGRTDWQEEIATLSGVNVPLAAYWTALGRPAPPDAPGATPIAWRSSIAFRAPAGLLPSGTRIIDGYFRRKDPLPALYYYVVTAFLARIGRLLGRLVGRG